jgi:hypothetical protein
MFRKIPSRIGDSKGSSTPKAKRTHKRAKSFKSILLRGSSVDAKERDQSPAPSSAVGPSPSSTSTSSISSSGHAHGLTSSHLASSKSEGGGSSGSHKALEEVSVEQQDEARLVATEEDVHAQADASSMTVDEKDDAATTTEDDGMCWSDFEDRYCGPDLQNDPLAHDFLFPDDDVSVVSEPRTQRALVSTVPVRLAPCDDLDCLIRMDQLNACACVARGARWYVCRAS